MSNTSNNKTLEDALIDVRRAYRLIYLYQDRLYHIIRHIRNSMYLNIYKRNSFYDGLGNKNSDFISWPVWYSIPLYNFCIALLPQSQNADNAPSENDWMLELHFIADGDAFDETGWEYFKDKDGEEITGEERPEQFVGVKESKSVLRIGIYQRDSDEKDSTWTKILKDNYCDYEKEIDLASLEDEKSLNEALDDFKKEAIKELKLDKNFFANRQEDNP